MFESHNITLVTDLNDAPNNKFIWVNNSSLQNAPESGAMHVLTLLTVRNSHGFQIAIKFNNSAMYIRTKADNEWKTWRSITLA